jgi:hypothetical protein
MKSDSVRNLDGPVSKTPQNKNLKIAFFLAGILDFLAISGVGYILAVWPFVAGDRFIIELLKIIAPLACGVSVFLGFLIWPAIRRRQGIIVIVTFLFVLITSFSLSRAMISNIYFDQSIASTYEVPVMSKYEKKN